MKCPVAHCSKRPGTASLPHAAAACVLERLQCAAFQFRGAERDCLQEAGAPNEAPAPEEAQLRIAWQYRRYIRRQQAEREAAAHPNPSPSPVPPRPPGSSFVRKGASPGPSPAPGGAVGGAGSSASGTGGRVGARDAGAARWWCHDFDLTQPMAEETLRGASTVRVVMRIVGFITRLNLCYHQHVVCSLQSGGKRGAPCGLSALQVSIVAFTS